MKPDTTPQPLNTSAASPRTLPKSPRRSSVELSLASWRKGLHDHAAPTRGRYSLDKASRYFTYAQTTSTLRHAAVVVLYPLPGLVSAFLPSLIPLQNPALGPRANVGSWLLVYTLYWIAMVSGLAHTRSVCCISHRDYSNGSILLIATIAALPAAGTFVALGFLWRFPVPFYSAIATVPFMVALVVAHALVFSGGRLRQDVQTKLVLYVPSMCLQLSQLVLYPIYSALFAAATDWQQSFLVMLLPGIKFLLRRAIYRVSRHLKDFAHEIAHCGVEICASMYQATIMQSTPAPVVTALIIAVDVVLNIFGILQYLDHVSIVPRTEILSRAAARVQHIAISPITEREIGRHATRRRNALRRLASSITHAEIILRRAAGSAATIVPVRAMPREPSSPRDDNIIVTHALELLQSAELMMVVEFLEVMMPVLNTLYVLVASQLESAKYNTKLRELHVDPRELAPAMASILLYISLQVLTLFAVSVVIHARYRLPTWTLLAFVLETHFASLQGKIMMWLAGILSVTVMHCGVDFTFKFDYSNLT